MLKKSFFVTIAIASAVFSQAQSINSFNEAVITGVSASLSGNDITLTVDPGATLFYDNTLFNVTDVFGVWALNYGPNPTLAAAGSTDGVWSFNKKTQSQGNIAGWNTNPNTGLTPGQSKTFTYSSIAGDVDTFGYHIRVDGTIPSTGGNTAYFTNAPVPEPASMVILGGAVAAAFARRRKNA